MSSKRKNGIAIVGMAFRLPGDISTVPQLWDALSEGKDLISSVDDQRWPIKNYLHPRKTELGKSYTFSAGVLSKIDEFDASFFNITPREARQMDPQQRILLETTWEALENGCQNVEQLDGSNCAVYVGIGSNEHTFKYINDCSVLYAHAMLGSCVSIAANRLSYIFNLRGPSIAIDTACSSSMVALHQACNSIWSGESSTAIVAGVNLLMSPISFIGFSKASMLSPSGRCKSFDATADGYVRSEGCVVLFLKPLADAERDGDPIHAVILNTGVNSDGRTRNIAMPSSELQAQLITKVHKEANISPEDIVYLEAHGTGTTIGDPIEALAIGTALGKKRQKKNKTPLLIGSIKSNLGHLEVASGLVGILKTVLCLQNNAVPATLHYKTPNPNIDLTELHLQVVDQLTDLSPSGLPHIMAVNSFGFGGTNAHVVLQAYASRAKSTSERAQHLNDLPPLLLSAHDERVLPERAKQYAQLLRLKPELYHDLAYTLANRHVLLNKSLLIDGATIPEIIDVLEQISVGHGVVHHNAIQGQYVGKSAPVALVYCGNGAQWQEMGCTLLAGNPLFRETIEEIDSLLPAQIGFSIKEELLNTQKNSRYLATEIAQPCLFALQVALTRCLIAQGVKVNAVVGHSVGEVAAAWACGALTLEHACQVIFQRSFWQGKTHGQGKMIALALSAGEATKLIKDLKLSSSLEVCAVNSPKGCTISGKKSAINQVHNFCIQQNILHWPLDLDYAFHSQQMEPLKANFLSGVNNIHPQANPINFFSTVTGTKRRGKKLDANYWWDNIRQPVQFEKAINQLIDDGVKVFLEVGPQPVLKRYIEDILHTRKASGAVFTTLKRHGDESFDLKQSIYKVLLSGANFDKSCLFPVVGKAISLPAYPWIKEVHRQQPTNENNNLTDLRIEHPLLGWRIRPQEFIWENHLDTQLVSYLADHVVDGTPVMPAAGFAEMALAASRLWYGNYHHDVRDIDILVPMVFEEKKCRITRFELQPQDGSFNIKSRNRHSDESWIVHAVGRLINEPVVSEPDHIDIMHLRKAANSPIEGEVLYAMARSIGLDYGQTFQGILYLWLQKRCALAQTTIHPSIFAGLEQYCIPPTILDSCFQLLIGVLHRQGYSSQAALPVRIGRIRMFAQLPEQIYLYAEILTITKQGIHAQFKIIDNLGRLIALIDDCRFKNISFSRQGDAMKMYVNKAHLLSCAAPLSIDFSTLTMIRQHVQDIAYTKKEDRVRHFEEVMPLFDVMIAQFIYRAIKTIAAQKQTFSLDSLCDYGGVIKSQQPLLKQYLRVLVEDGLLLKTQSQEYTFVEPKEQYDAEFIWNALLNHYPNYLSELSIVGRWSLHLTSLLQGKITTEEFLPSLHDDTFHYFLNSAPSADGIHILVRESIQAIVARWPSERRLRILEIGQGFSSLTLNLLESLPAERTDYLIALGDETASYEAKHYLSKYLFAKTTTLALDSDFINQSSLAEQSFDIILLRNCLHAVDNVLHPLTMLRSLLSKNGILLLMERHSDRLYDMSLGLRPEWWRLNDENEPLSRFYSLPTWGKLLQDAGFQYTEALPEPGAAQREGSFLFLAQPLSDTTTVFAPQIRPQPIDIIVVTSQHKAKDYLTQAIENKGAIADIYFVSNDNEAFDCSSKLLQQSLAPFIKKSTRLRLVVLLDARIEMEQAGVKCNEVIDLIKTIERYNWTVQPQVILVTSNAAPCDLIPTTIADNPVQATLWGLGRVLINEYPGFDCKLIDLQGDITPELAANLANELVLNDGEDEIILTATARYGIRLMMPTAAHLEQSVLQEYRLDFERSGSLHHLKWFPVQEIKLADDEVQIKPHATGLNFRDLMYTMGFIPDEAVQDGFLGATLGMEFAGEILATGKKVSNFKVGDRVMGFAPASFSTTTSTKAYAIAHLPSQWDYSAGAGVPIAFFTAYYALHHLAHLQPGERILIHGAAGGVGIAAIQLARNIGAEIYTTAGSASKRDFLRLLGVRNIFDSRSLVFAEQIMQETANEGVDVILNCLSGEAINANLTILKPFGRFLELGKRDFYLNSKIGLRPFKNNIAYFGIDADQLIIKNPQLCSQIFGNILVLFEQNVLSPLPYREFANNSIHDAFRYMQQSKHIGKIIVRFTEKPNDHLLNFKSLSSLSLCPNSAYLITGGFSGFGLKSAQYLAEKGARHLILLGRQGLVKEEAKNAVSRLTEQGIKVDIHALDISDPMQIQQLINSLQQNKVLLKGIIHAATVYEDALIKNLDTQKMNNVFAAKVKGAWNLHHSTKNLLLDFFVVYSSVTTLFGNPGQGNYVAANHYLEKLISLRRKQGLSGLFVAWGPIYDAGYLARNEKLRALLMTQMGGQIFTSEHALNWLEQLILNKEMGAAIADLNLRKMQRAFPKMNAPKYSKLLSIEEHKNSKYTKQTDIHELLSGKSTQEALEIVSNILADEVARILRLPKEKIDRKESLLNIGLDSLVGAELSNAIEQRFNFPLPMMTLSQGFSLDTLTERIVSQLSNQNEINEEHESPVLRVMHEAARHGEIISVKEAIELEQESRIIESTVQ
ncbi:SDR family NAD(P)-dependent oxidoreductase [Legionella sp. WA2022007384]